jgi:hypothetical protein
VRTDGDNANSGGANTAGGAWLTIQKAAATMLEGDTVFVQPGTYGETVAPVNGGTATDPITYQAVGVVVIDGNNIRCQALDVSGTNYLTFDGFEITDQPDCGNTDSAVAIANSDNIVIRNNVIHDTGRDAVFFSGTSSNGLVESNLIYNIDDDGATPTGGGNHTFRANTFAGTIVGWTLEGGDASNLFEDNIFWAADIQNTALGTFNYNDYNSAVLPGTGNISSDPLFVNAAGADFHLSQIAAGQGSDSPAVDVGSDTAVNLGFSDRSTRSDEVADAGTMDLGFHYAIVPAAAITGTIVPSATVAEIVVVGETIVITLANDSWVGPGAAFDAVRQDIIDGLDSAGGEANGWNNEVRDKQGVGGVIRTNATTVTITLDAQAAYDIAASETITVTVPASAVTSAGAIVATPTFDVEPVVVSILDAWTTGSTHTVSAGSDRLLVFILGAENDTSPVASISSVTWGSQNLTKIDHAVETGVTSYENRLEMWYLNEAGIAAASGSSFAVVWSGTTPIDQLIAAVTLKNVDQTTPVSSFNNGNIASANAVQIASALTVNSDDMAIYGTGSGEQGRTHTPSAGYIEGNEQDSGGFGQVLANATKQITSAGSEQPTAAWSGAANSRLVIVGAVFAVAP